MKFTIGDGVTFRAYLKNMDSSDLSKWMIFDQEEYSLSMLVYPVFPESWDIWDEYEELENQVLGQGKGYGNLLSKEQLEDILSNLKMQKHDYSDSELEAAINHYSKKDSFYEIKHT